ncbi:hypothetical protein AB1N83_011697 [Pleurotus pulmonarius]
MSTFQLIDSPRPMKVSRPFIHPPNSQRWIAVEGDLCLYQVSSFLVALSPTTRSGISSSLLTATYSSGFRSLTNGPQIGDFVDFIKIFSYCLPHPSRADFINLTPSLIGPGKYVGISVKLPILYHTSRFRIRQAMDHRSMILRPISAWGQPPIGDHALVCAHETSDSFIASLGTK